MINMTLQALRDSGPGAPDSGPITFTIIISAMGVAILGLAGYIKIILSDREKKIAEKDAVIEAKNAQIAQLYDKRIQDLRDQISLTTTLEDVTYRERKKKGGDQDVH
jgi:hypothetical protein